MIVNKELKEELSKDLHLALHLLHSMSKYKIKLAKYGKAGTKVLVGHHNALPNARANFNSSLIKSTIIKCQKVPTWPKKVQFKTVNKGHLLFVESPQS